jgi:hypothetical protein
MRPDTAIVQPQRDEAARDAVAKRLVRLERREAHSEHFVIETAHHKDPDDDREAHDRARGEHEFERPCGPRRACYSHR